MYYQTLAGKCPLDLMSYGKDTIKAVQYFKEKYQKIIKAADMMLEKPFALNGLETSFKTALKNAGIRDFHFHDLRHTFSSHLVMAGVDLATVSRLLGHKTLTMTLRYAHLAPSHMVNAVNLLDSTLTGKPTIQKLYNSGVVSHV